MVSITDHGSASPGRKQCVRQRKRCYAAINDSSRSRQVEFVSSVLRDPDARNKHHCCRAISVNTRSLINFGACLKCNWDVWMMSPAAESKASPTLPSCKFRKNISQIRFPQAEERLESTIYIAHPKSTGYRFTTSLRQSWQPPQRPNCNTDAVSPGQPLVDRVLDRNQPKFERGPLYQRIMDNLSKSLPRSFESMARSLPDVTDKLSE